MFMQPGAGAPPGAGGRLSPARAGLGGRSTKRRLSAAAHPEPPDVPGERGGGDCAPPSPPSHWLSAPSLTALLYLIAEPRPLGHAPCRGGDPAPCASLPARSRSPAASQLAPAPSALLSHWPAVPCPRPRPLNGERPSPSRSVPRVGNQRALRLGVG